VVRSAVPNATEEGAGFYVVRIRPIANAARARSPRQAVFYIGTDEAESFSDAAQQAAQRYAEPKRWRRVCATRSRGGGGKLFLLYRYRTQAETPQGNISKLQREHVANIAVEKK